MGFKESGTLLDIILHNKNLISNTQVIGCPYNDHTFIVGSIEIEKVKTESETLTYYDIILILFSYSNR